MFKKNEVTGNQLAAILEALAIQGQRQQCLLELVEQHQQLLASIEHQQQYQYQLLHLIEQKKLTSTEMVELNPFFKRNFLSNSDSAVQKNLIATWRSQEQLLVSHQELMESGFRTFSQNDEDGILLRLFTHIGTTNKFVIEIGSNCSDSVVGIPENLSSNLLINHGWNGAIFELDENECSRMRYFYARHHSTRHFHWEKAGENTYFSPQIIQQAVCPDNIDSLIGGVCELAEPDLMIIDIDGGDFEVMERLTVVRPRVIVVEYEKRFRERYSVVQKGKSDFSANWQQSGAASLSAWVKLMASMGYLLCTASSCCFNAFFVRADIAQGKFEELSAKQVFDNHPVFSMMGDDYWLSPDDTWSEV